MTKRPRPPGATRNQPLTNPLDSANWQERWTALWSSLGAEPPPSLLGDLQGRYREPHRAYHTLRHLDECFAAFDSARAQAEHPAEIELALWFHDAIYDTRAADCEEQSARLSREALAQAGLDPVRIARVEALVLATKHSNPATGGDAMLLLDVDLSILGAETARFDEYEEQVRREYAWVPEAAFRAARRRILASFEARPRLYQTPSFAARLESRARANLARAIARLDLASPSS